MFNSYVAEVINRFVGNAISERDKFNHNLCQWGTRALMQKVALKERSEGRGISHDMTEAIEAIQNYAKSLYRENYNSTLTQIGEEIYSRAEACIATTSARSKWFTENLPYREHTFQVKVEGGTEELIQLFRIVENMGRILKGDYDEFESARILRLSRYCDFIS